MKENSSRARASWGMAAVVLAIGASVVVWRVWQTRPSLVDRVEETDDFGAVTPGSGSVVAANQVIFTWQAVEGADRYQIEATGADGETLAAFEVGADRLSAHWPVSSTPPARGAMTYRLRAFASERIIAETRPIRIRIR